MFRFTRLFVSAVNKEIVRVYDRQILMSITKLKAQYRIEAKNYYWISLGG
jgi:hypothetical protein